MANVLLNSAPPPASVAGLQRIAGGGAATATSIVPAGHIYLIVYSEENGAYYKERIRDIDATKQLNKG